MFFKYTRNEILFLILKSEQTKAGVFWVGNIPLLEKGINNDKDFLIDRKLFANKKFFTYKDIEYLMADNEDFLFLQNWLDLNNSFNEDNADILNKNLDDKLYNIKVKDIIDNYLFFKKYFKLT